MDMDASIKDRLRETRRKKRLRLLRLVIIVVLFIAGTVSLWRYIHRPEFAFGHTNISGTNKLKEEDILKMAGTTAPMNMFNISFDRVRDGLQQDVRFHSSSVEYKWPNEMRIVVQEREPALYVANSYRSYVQLDYKGVVLAVSTAIPDAKAPMLVGESCGNVFIGDEIKNANVMKVLAFHQKLSLEAKDQIVEIVNDPKLGVKLRQRNGIQVLLGPVEELDSKVELFMTVFRQLKGKNIQAEYIDLTFSKPYIKLKPEAMKVKK